MGDKKMPLTADQIRELQAQLGLSDTKIARALGVTRQTWRNWRTGQTCPLFAQHALVWMMTLRRLDPANDNLPPGVRVNL
jgi:DNA-binding transcriptional regulator YiaG